METQFQYIREQAKKYRQVADQPATLFKALVTEDKSFQNRRKVNWITNKVYQYKANSLKTYKTLFRPGHFQPYKSLGISTE